MKKLSVPLQRWRSRGWRPLGLAQLHLAAPLSTILGTLVLLVLTAQPLGSQKPAFDVMEATIADIHAAYRDGRVTAREVVQQYLDRIEAYDKNGPNINCVITINPKALQEADALDAAFKKSGLVGPLHGIPVALKDQIDAAGLPTTLGAIVLKDNIPTRDAFVTEKLKKAGAIVLFKATLGEMGGGDTYGSLFGITRNPYDLERTVGGSSGGPAACVAANFATVGIGQEGFASIRRPSIWNSIVGMRPTPGLVSRAGVWGGWPSRRGQLGPMTRTVADLAKLLDVMVAYDPEDPLTALGVGHFPDTYTKFLDKNGLKGARIGILREPMGIFSKPDSEDFKRVTALFDRSVEELKKAGAVVIDPIVVPRLNELLNKRGAGGDDGSTGGDSAAVYFSRNPNSRFKSGADVRNAPEYKQNMNRRSSAAVVITRLDTEAGKRQPSDTETAAREELNINVLKVMADHDLDAIVHKAVEHTPTLIRDGVNPPYVDMVGSSHLNTFLVYAASIVVPAGFTSDGLPVGITFFGRAYSEPTMIRLAYAYEQATHHRKPPKTTPALSTTSTSTSHE